MKRRSAWWVALLAVGVVFTGCKTLDTMTGAMTSVGVMTGTISADTKNSIDKSASAMGEAMFDKLTPENEYYIGRSVVATMVANYKLSPDRDLERYLNRLGQTLAAYSDMPNTFKGYRFMVLDTDEVNAFAAPGGFIMISRGLLRQCRSEDAVAAILAHEIGHIELRHAMKAITKGRWTSAAGVVGAETFKSATGVQNEQLAGVLKDSVGDIAGTFARGYDRSMEFAADKASVRIMSKVGYSPQGLKDVLLELQKHSKPGDAGFGQTHPTPEKRLAEIEAAVKKAGPIVEPTARKARFEKFTRGV